MSQGSIVDTIDLNLAPSVLMKSPRFCYLIKLCDLMSSCAYSSLVGFEPTTTRNVGHDGCLQVAFGFICGNLTSYDCLALGLMTICIFTMLGLSHVSPDLCELF
jgi:hypothetical protein